MDLFATLAIIFQLILLEGLLSIDNAAVLAALTFHLPDHAEPPKPLNHPIAKKLFGVDQRSSALKAGILGAYIGRGIMLLLASIIIKNPLLKVIGAGYLIYLTLSHFLKKDGQKNAKSHGDGFWQTVLAIELADLAFSLDNIVAAVSLSDRLWVVAIGVFIGIAVMRFGATYIMHLMEREPVLAHGAYLVIFVIAVELLVREFFQIETPYLLKFLLSIGILVGTVAVTRLANKRQKTAIRK